MSADKRTSGARKSQVSPRAALQSQWQQHLETARQTIEKLVNAPGNSLMTIAVIGIALLLPTTLFVALDNISRLSGNAGSASQFSVYLQDDVSPAKGLQISEQLLTRNDVATSRYISPTDAAVEFAAYSGLGDVLSALDENPLPGTILITPLSLERSAIATLRSDLEQLPDVALVQLDLEWIERLQGFLQLARRTSAGLMVVLGIAVLFIVGNTIRVAIEGRRAEIVVIKLVGGTDQYVARPFLYSGALFGLAGAVVARTLLFVLLLGLQGPVNTLLRLYGSEASLFGLSPLNTLLLLAMGTLLGWLGAWLSVRQHLVAIQPR